jgi:glucose/arabinose dehydrogenase
MFVAIREGEFTSVMIKSVTAALFALLFACGLGFAQPADAPKSETPKADAPKSEAPKAEEPKKPAEFEPQVGQAGKDVIWVPTPQDTVDRMLDMAAVKPDDFVIDLGSGDGRTVITAAKRGARALGIEYNPKMATSSRPTSPRPPCSPCTSCRGSTCSFARPF